MLAWFYRPVEEEQCRQLVEPSKAQFVVSCGLMGWLLLCYIPQWARMVSRKSAEGISTFYILLGSLSGVCAVGNIMMLPSSATEIGCCRSNARLACISNLLGMFQVIFGISCFWIVLFMYFYYSEREASIESHTLQRTTSRLRHTFRRAREAEMVLVVSNAFALIILIVSAVILHQFPWASQTWADILGVSLTVGACLQWLPQIVTTWRLGHLGSLSSTSLCFMAPYTWIFGISMIIRVGINGWSAWIVYVLVGTMQVVLIGFAIVFSLRKKQQSDDESDTKDETLWRGAEHTEMSQSMILHANESSPLLGDVKQVHSAA